ncbi:MAG: HAMP domain-containing histidine kinase [Deltaproteobacteria bacterium]|nr:HAMP domain-containing histidine kinase [Deltaproteobacteria bacterium]
MAKIKIQFITFFILLALAFGSLVVYAYNQISREEKHLWEGISENVFNQMQAGISEFLSKEDARSFSEYRYYYIPETQQKGYALNISPLSTPPHDDPRGLIGYFQINPDGSFHTPYLPPKKDQDKLDDLALRKNLQDRLSLVTQTLQGDIKTNLPKTNTAETTANKNNTIDLPPAQPLALLSRSTIYPNPLKEQKPSEEKKHTAKLKSRPSKISSPDLGASVPDTEQSIDDKATQAVVTNTAQFETFKQQKIFADVDTIKKKEDQDSAQKTPVETQASVLTDPFRARLVDWKDIIFYRKIWLDQKMYIQGFVIEIDRLYTWLMESSFNNSILPAFSFSNIRWNDRVLAGLQSLSTITHAQILFERQLGYPLNQFTWSIYYHRLPDSSGRKLLHLMTALLTLILTLGLYMIYRSAASVVILSQKRQDFVSAVTHELKTPLTSIRMFSEMLSEGWVKDEAKKQEYYQVMTKEGDRLSRLIDNVLQLARLEKHNYRFNLNTTEPAKDFETLSQELKDLVLKNGFEWETGAGKNIPAITYDPEALKQVLIILVDNSIKFSKDSTKKIISMKLETKANQVIWSITDQGPGIPQAELKKIFNKFYRIENEMTRKTKGTGIGLAMAKMIIDGMGGEIEAVNNPDGGLTVTLIFQCKPC